MQLVDFELDTVIACIKGMPPGEYTLRELLGEVWTIVRRPKFYGRRFKQAVNAGLIPGVRFLRKQSNQTPLYEWRGH